VSELDDVGPIDYIVLEWAGEPRGEVAPLLLDLVERGIIRVLDIAFMTKDADGTVTAIDIGDLPAAAELFAEFEGAASGLLGLDDLEASAAVLVWENRWAAPIARALRESGGQLVASGRIPVQAILASLDALEPTT
jgi:hypothetical protein